MKKLTVCAACGQEHPLAFSQELVDYYHEVLALKDPEELRSGIIELASMFAAEYDSTDPEYEETFHAYFDEYERARLAFEQQSMKLGRLALLVVKGCTEPKDDTVEAVLTPKKVNNPSWN
jgi:hypothetical protein